MSCDRYTVAIVDHACGAEIPADAATHLRTCGACSRLFDEQRRLLQDLDQELQRALAIEPSARFLPDAMAGVERSALRSRRIMWWIAPAAAAAALVLVTVTALRFGEQRPAGRHEPAAPPAASSAPAGERTTSNVTPSAPAQGASRQATARRRGERTKTVERTTTLTRDHGSRLHADVVVPAGQSRAIERYLSLVRRGALDTSALADSDRTSAATPADLVIAPLSVEAIDVPDGESEIGPSVDRRGDPDQDRERGV
jgi:hypothetical protein